MVMDHVHVNSLIIKFQMSKKKQQKKPGNWLIHVLGVGNIFNSK